MATIFTALILLLLISYLCFTLGRIYEMNQEIKRTEEEIARIEAEIEAIDREIAELEEEGDSDAR